MRAHFKLGTFASNCSGGMSITKVPERWAATWDDNLLLAKMLDESGIDFMLPIARWIGYGGETDFQGHVLETITWTAGLLAATRNIYVFATTHTGLHNPVVAAKQLATIDQIGHGRGGLNIVAGWNEPEYRALGATLPREHAARYALAQEWFDVIEALWTRDAPFDWKGKYFTLEQVYGKPRPKRRPPIINAAGSGEGREFAVRNSDYLFTPVIDIERSAAEVAKLKAMAEALGRRIEVFTLAHVVCRPTAREARDYVAHFTGAMTDEPAVERLMNLQFAFAKSSPPEELVKIRDRVAMGHGGFPLIGTPEMVADGIISLHRAGFDGTTISFVNYVDEFPYFRDAVLPLLERAGIRQPLA
jgi:FMNH2-dependent dimethyl sulfone monooxygenase